jgi:hypothetical protein
MLLHGMISPANSMTSPTTTLWMSIVCSSPSWMTLMTCSSLFSLSEFERLELLLHLSIVQQPDENDNENGNKDSTPSTHSMVVLLQGKARLAAKSRCRRGKVRANTLRHCHRVSEMKHHEVNARRIRWVAPSQEDNHTPGTHPPHPILPFRDPVVADPFPF